MFKKTLNFNMYIILKIIYFKSITFHTFPVTIIKNNVEIYFLYYLIYIILYYILILFNILFIFYAQFYLIRHQQSFVSPLFDRMFIAA